MQGTSRMNIKNTDRCLEIGRCWIETPDQVSPLFPPSDQANLWILFMSGHDGSSSHHSASYRLRYGQSCYMNREPWLPWIRLVHVLLLIHSQAVRLWTNDMPYLSDKQTCGVPFRVDFSVMLGCKQRSCEFELVNATQTSLLSQKWLITGKTRWAW
jgi:hypothetical protein